MKKILTFTAIAALSGLLFGQSVESGGFTPSEIRPDGSARYTVILKDINGNIDASSIPMPKQLQIVGQSRSQSFSMGSGGNSSTLELIYHVRPLSEGEFTVPAWNVTYNGKKYTVNAAKLKVAPKAQVQSQDEEDTFASGAMGMPFGFGSVFGGMNGSSRASAQQSRRQMQSYEDSLRNSAKLEVILPREKIYVGEAIPCRLVFSYDKSLSERGFKLSQLLPRIQNADAFDCPDFKNEPVLDTSDADKIKLTYNTVITPLKVGAYELDFSAQGSFSREIGIDEMMNMSLAERMGSLGFGRRIPFEIQMPAKKVEVSPLPTEGKPQNFGGAIGKFIVEGVTVDPDVLSVGEPCTITAKIIGTGNFGRITAPELENTPDWKTYKPKSSFADETGGMGNIGVKTFEFTAVPTKADLKFAPRFAFSYFDPDTEKYVEITSREIGVSVAPTRRSQRAAEIAERDKTPEEPTFKNIVETDSHTREGGLLFSPYFWGAQMLFLALVLAFVVNRRNAMRLKNDPEFAKRILCSKQAKAFLVKAAHDAKTGNVADFLSDARSALQYELAADSQFEAPALLLREAEDIMRKVEFSDEDMKSVALFFEGKDAIAFGGLNPSDLNLHELLGKLEKLSAKIKSRI